MNLIIAVVLAFQLIEFVIQVCIFVCFAVRYECIGLSIEDAYECDHCSGSCISID